MKNIGLFILLCGACITVFTVFTIFTKEKVVEIGSLEITRDKPHHLNWSPLIGIAVMAVGGAVLWKSNKQ